MIDYTNILYYDDFHHGVKNDKKTEINSGYTLYIFCIK